MPTEPTFDEFLYQITQVLLPAWQLRSIDAHEPVQSASLPAPWQLLGCGNYAGVVCHPDFPDWIVKRYAPGRPGLAEEAEVYRKLGQHPGFSSCLHIGPDYLILRRIWGRTFWRCCIEGELITPRAVEDIDLAIDWARQRGLYPHDVHAKNVMQYAGRGYIVDISDFYKAEPCDHWQDFKRVYRWFYRPVLGRWPRPIPEWAMNAIRRSYRRLRRLLGRRK